MINTHHVSTICLIYFALAMETEVGSDRCYYTYSSRRVQLVLRSGVLWQFLQYFCRIKAWPNAIFKILGQRKISALNLVFTTIHVVQVLSPPCNHLGLETTNKPNMKLYTVNKNWKWSINKQRSDNSSQHAKWLVFFWCNPSSPSYSLCVWLTIFLMHKGWNLNFSNGVFRPLCRQAKQWKGMIPVSPSVWPE